MPSRRYLLLLLLCLPVLALDAWALVDFARFPLAPEHNFNSTVFRAVLALATLPLTVLVGVLIVRRVPGNIIGPLLVLWSGSVAYMSIRSGAPLDQLTIYYVYNVVAGWLALFVLLAHFPTGRLHPPGAARWYYPLLWIQIAIMPLVILSTARLDIPGQPANPLAVPWLAEREQALTLLSLVNFIPLLAMAIIAPALRYRGARPLERQQIKWLAWLGGAFAVYTVLGLVAYPLLTGGAVMNPGYGLFGLLVYGFATAFPAAAIGVSMLRYRLWDIDRLIRRTLVYSLLTLVLTLIYLGGVLALRAVFALLFQLDSSDLAVVISTLAIAALFSPLRARIQREIDRRFYRQKYDAEQVLMRFAATARGEVTIGPLASALLRTAEETMQPEQLSLWLARPASPEGPAIIENPGKI